MMDLKRNAGSIMRQVGRGESLILNYHGKPAARLAPIPSRRAKTSASDPFYSLTELATTKDKHFKEVGFKPLLID